MRLFLNDKEAQLVKNTMAYASAMMVDKNRELAQKIIERIELCEQLQKSENKSK